MKRFERYFKKGDILKMYSHKDALPTNVQCPDLKQEWPSQQRKLGTSVMEGEVTLNQATC